eukprot:1777704-Pleurochrysis_carterae.AAC.1
MLVPRQSCTDLRVERWCLLLELRLGFEPRALLRVRAPRLVVRRAKCLLLLGRGSLRARRRRKLVRREWIMKRNAICTSSN